MRAARVGGLVLLLVSPTAHAAPPRPVPATQSVAVYVYAEDAAAAPMAARANDALIRTGTQHGNRTSSQARVGELLDRSPEDLVHASSTLAIGRAAFKQALQEYSQVHLDAAEEALLRANDAFLDAAAAPPYQELRDIHFYLGIVALNLGQTDGALAQFREALFFSPSYTPDANTFPPSVVNAFAQARQSLSTGTRGTVRIEADKTGAVVLVDGILKGSIPRLVDLPEGTHYLEVRAPGAVAQLIPVHVQSGQEAPVLALIKTASIPMRKLWSDPSGEEGAATIARILGVDKLVIASARSTVTGVAAFAIHGAAFDAASGHRTTTAEEAVTRDLSVAERRLDHLAESLFQAKQGYKGISHAAVVATRARMFSPYELRVALETGAAYMDHYYDANGHSQAATGFGQGTSAANNSEVLGRQPDHGFDWYEESRTVLHVRYGLREGTTVFVDLPFYAKRLEYNFDQDNSGTIDPPGETGITRNDQGLGDVTMGADVRIPPAEGGIFALVLATARAKLPTGNADVTGSAPNGTRFPYLGEYQHLPMGSGQPDLYLGATGVITGDATSLTAEAGYNARFQGVLPYYYNGAGQNQGIKIGDEQSLRLEGALVGSTWFSIAASASFLHRDSTRHFVNPGDDEPGTTAPDFFLLTGGLAVRANLSEKTDAGLVLEMPAWGRNTITYSPLDVVGPRGYLYYGMRF